jgi:protein gp37
VSDNSSIEWTGTTWNPTTGCDKVSPGCGLPRPGTDDEATGQTGGCYALAMAKRLKGMGSAKYQNDGDPRTSGPGFGLAMHEDALTDPMRWRKPRTVFVNSMSDLFHDAVSDEFIARVFAVMAATPHRTYQVLTKRHGRMRSLLRDTCRCQGSGVGHVPGVHFRSAMEWAATPHSPTYVPGLESGLSHRMRWPLPIVWLGVSVEDQKWADIRIPALLDTPAAVRFLSCEPLLGPVDLREEWLAGPYDCACDDPAGCRSIDWVITGGESGPRARPCDPAWVRDLRDQCLTAGTAFFHKQWGGIRPKSGGRLLNGRTWDQMPGQEATR